MRTGATGNGFTVWAESPGSVLDALEVNADRGLQATDIRQRRDRYGANAIEGAPARSIMMAACSSPEGFATSCPAIGGAEP